MELLTETLKKIEKVDSKRGKETLKKFDTKMKPKGSLGVLEILAGKVIGITGEENYRIEKKLHLVAAGDNGVVEEGISSCPVEYTRIVSEAMVNEIAAIGIMCRTLNVELKVIDVGISGDIKGKYPNLIHKKIRRGTRNFMKEPAMTMEETIEAIEVGIETVSKNKGYHLYSNGEMGIGNTTTSSALLYALTDSKVEDLVGFGGGLSKEGYEKKKKIVKEIVEKNSLKEKDPLEILMWVGGYEIATMVGFYLGCARNKKPILVDGFISSIAALIAVRLKKEVRGYIIFTHKSEEPGVKIIMEELKEEAFLHLRMRLGEGTGALLAYPIVETALELYKGMKSKDEVYQLLN